MSQPYKKIRLSSPRNDPSEMSLNNLMADVNFEDEFWIPPAEDENVPKNGQEDLRSANSNQWRRCVVESIERGDNNSLILLLSEENCDHGISCRLEPPWTSSSRLQIGDLISIKPHWCSEKKIYKVDRDHGYLVTLPDHLISGTTMMGSLFCRRKGMLQEMFKGMDADNEIMMVGTIVHEILENVLVQNMRSLAQIKEYCQDYIRTPAVNFMLYSSGCTREKLSEEVSRFVPKIHGFISRYVARDAKTELATGKEDYQGVIEDIEDTEENIWMPKMGLKGKIDLTVRVKSGSTRETIPLELKTGKASFSAEHKGQVTLYQMMMEESGRDARSGLLLYLREGILREVVSTRHEKRDLIILRNQLSHYLSRKYTQKYGANRFLEYPEPIHHKTACENCPYNTICTSLLKRDDTKELKENHPLRQCQRIDHLSEMDLDYFFHWCHIAYLEDQETIRNIAVSNIWTDPMEKRIRERKTIFGLKLNSLKEEDLGEYYHIFDIRTAGHYDLKKGDYIIVSSPPDNWAVATGFVIEISDSQITLNLSKKLMDFRNKALRVDKYESQSMLSYHLTNLGCLLEDTERSSRLRNIITGVVEPTFDDSATTAVLKTPVAEKILKGLNEGQRDAIRKSLSAQNYLLIKGLPGTGKTQTLSALIRLLVVGGKSVLITAHTHSAVDNLLLRIKGHTIPFLRLGSASRTHPEIREFCESNVVEKCNTPEGIAAAFNSFPIVAVTCLGAAHALLARRQFDVCIVDEATQVIQSALLRPLFSCTKFILVGDPDQLPPVLQSSEAIRCGGDRSLFLQLDDEEKNTTATLTLQYRMNRTITKLANQFMYKNELRCGNETVEKQSLANFDLQLLPQADKKLFVRILSPHLDLATLLIDTGSVEDLNTFGQRQSGKVNANHCEVAFILKTLSYLKTMGFPLECAGVIAPYRVQVDAIKETTRKRFGQDHKLEINTVDQYQGRDKDLIIYSGTRTQLPTHENGNPPKDSDILNDKRRLNVAITRAKKKLILIGDRKCLEAYAPFAELFKYLKGLQVINLPRSLLEEYLKEFGTDF